jgi:hypothetical protein
MSSTYNNNVNPMQGMMRINGTDIQVFDGNSWLNLPASYATVELNGETQTILQWARDKRNQELEYERMAKEHPAVQHAIDAIKKAEKQLDLIVKLSKEHGEQLETS